MEWLFLIKKMWPLVAALGLVIVLGGVYLKGQAVGKEKCQRAIQEIIQTEQKKQADLVKELESARNKRQVEVREDIEIIENTVGECVDAPMPDEWINILRD